MHVNKVMQTPTTCARLQQLLEAGALTNAHQRTGERLLKRLQSDISVVLVGTEVATKYDLLQSLTASKLPRTSIRVVDWQTAFDFAQADVCIWCTTEFSPNEAAIWRDVPDWLKDHSFLVAVSENGVAGGKAGQAALQTLDDIAAEEFYGLLPITTCEGTRRSDVDALVREVTKLVQTGLRADADNAEIFIQRNQSKPALARAKLIDKPSKQTTPDAMPIDVSVDAATMAKQPALNPIYAKALGTMRHHLVDLDPLMRATEDDEIQDILTICAETAEAVADVLSDSDLVDPNFENILTETLTVADKILLMSVEGGVAPAVDAVTCLLQLQRELELQNAC